MSDVISPATRDLITACGDGDVEAALEALEKGADITNYIPLSFASVGGHTDVVRLLLEHGADPNETRTDDGATPLWDASSNGHFDAVKLLLKGGADANKPRSADGTTPLFVATWQKHPDVVKLLLDRGANPNKAEIIDGRTPLWQASRMGHDEVVKLLLDSGADPNKGNNNGDTPLWQASRKEHDEVVKLLLDSGADPNKGNNNGDTPLWQAIRKEHDEVVKLLLDRGADPNMARNGWTPLYMASLREHTDVVMLLLDHGADPNKARTDNGWTPLLIASENGYNDITEMLLDHGADPNKASTDNGWTPLLIASENGYNDITEMLLDHGADPNKASTDGGETPLYLASKNVHPKIVLMLMENGARVDAKGAFDRTPLAVILEYHLDYYSPEERASVLQIVQCLVAAGAKLAYQRDDGREFNAVERARTSRLDEITKWLEIAKGLPSRGAIIKSLVTNQSAGEIDMGLFVSRYLSASEERAAALAGPQRDGSAVLELCKQVRMKWAPVRHGLFHPRYRSTVLCLLMVVRRKKEAFPGAVRSIRTEVPREVWFIIIEQLSRYGPESSFGPLDFTPPRSEALPPVQNGTGISTDFTAAKAALNTGAPRRAKGGVPVVDFEVEYGRAMAGTLSRIGQLLKRAPGDPNLAAARAAALEISGNLDRRIKAKTTAGGSPLVVECARVLLELETRLSATERMKVVKACRNLFDTAADAMTKIHIQTGTLPGDYRPEA
jgi:ankyrin repeat protein